MPPPDEKRRPAGEPDGDQGNGFSGQGQRSSNNGSMASPPAELSVPVITPYAQALDSALHMAQLGFPVHPVRIQLYLTSSGQPKKRPFGLPGGWQLGGLTGPDAIRARFVEIGATGYMVACGPSGLTVVDLDVKGDGEANWAAAGGAAHAAFEVRTWSGGRHLYFRSAGARNTSGRPGVLMCGVSAVGCSAPVRWCSDSTGRLPATIRSWRVPLCDRVLRLNRPTWHRSSAPCAQARRSSPGNGLASVPFSPRLGATPDLLPWRRVEST
jgi:Bifunctional DNA primase/polymerase, N-terminal